MAGLPIITYSTNNPYYLLYCLLQAKHANPDSPVCLLGNETNDFYGFVEHGYISDYFEQAKEIEEKYVHLSTNRAEFEKICIFRWFVCASFMREKGYTRAFLTDNDMMIYSDLTEVQKFYADADFTMMRMSTGAGMFLNSLDAIDDFFKFVLDFYNGSELFRQAYHGFHHGKDGKPELNVSDMFLLAEFAKTGRWNVVDTSRVVNGGYVEENLNSPGEFEVKNGMKRVYWCNNLPYGRHREHKQLVKFHMLQFHGLNGKPLMRPACNLWPVR